MFFMFFMFFLFLIVDAAKIIFILFCLKFYFLFLDGCAWFCAYQHASRYRIPAKFSPQARPAVRQQHVASRFSATCTILLAKIGQGCASAWRCRDVPWRVSTWCVIKRHVSTMPRPYARNPIQFPLPPFPIFS